MRFDTDLWTSRSIDSQIQNPSENCVATDGYILATRFPVYKVPSLSNVMCEPIRATTCRDVSDFLFTGLLFRKLRKLHLWILKTNQLKKRGPHPVTYCRILSTSTIHQFLRKWTQVNMYRYRYRYRYPILIP